MKILLAAVLIAQFNTPVGDAVQGLYAYEQQLPPGIKLEIDWEDKLHTDKNSVIRSGFIVNGVHGRMDYRDALTAILKDSGLYWQMLDEHTVIVRIDKEPGKPKAEGPDGIELPKADWKK